MSKTETSVEENTPNWEMFSDQEIALEIVRLSELCGYLANSRHYSNYQDDRYVTNIGKLDQFRTEAKKRDMELNI